MDPISPVSTLSIRGEQASSSNPSGDPLQNSKIKQKKQTREEDLEAAVPTWEASGVATRNAATLAGARHATVATDEKHDEDGMKRFLDVLGGALDATVRGTVEATKTGWDKIAAAIANK